MKKIAVFFKLPGAKDEPLSKPDYWTAYSELSETISARGAQMYITRGQSTYLGNGLFSRSWVIEEGNLRETGPVTVEVIFDKGRFNSDGTIPVFNNKKIQDYCDDKWMMYQHLSHHCPKTFYAENSTQLQPIISQISTEYVVFKPRVGAGGDGVVIEKKAYFSHTSLSLKFPAIISEFIDTSDGIPGIVEGMHDLRVAIFDGELLYSYVRTPPNGSLLANVAKGGTFAMVNIKRLPQEILNIITSIDTEIKDVGHRFYTVDFGWTSEGPKIIEMNSFIGLLPNKDGAVFKLLKEKLVSVFMAL